MHTALGQEHEERVLFRGGKAGCPMQGHCVVSMYARSEITSIKWAVNVDHFGALWRCIPLSMHHFNFTLGHFIS